jgi:hypothetical protein
MKRYVVYLEDKSKKTLSTHYPEIFRDLITEMLGGSVYVEQDDKTPVIFRAKNIINNRLVAVIIEQE